MSWVTTPIFSKVEHDTRLLLSCAGPLPTASKCHCITKNEANLPHLSLAFRRLSCPVIEVLYMLCRRSAPELRPGWGFRRQTGLYTHIPSFGTYQAPLHCTHCHPNNLQPDGLKVMGTPLYLFPKITESDLDTSNKNDC